MSVITAVSSGLDKIISILKPCSCDELRPIHIPLGRGLGERLSGALRGHHSILLGLPNPSPDCNCCSLR